MTARRVDVLILEQDAQRLESLARGLGAAGLHVAPRRLVLPSPDEVEEAIRGLHPASLVIDIPTPGSEPWTLYRSLLERGTLAELPVILTSNEKLAVESAHNLSVLALGENREREEPRIASEIWLALGEEPKEESEPVLEGAPGDG